MKTIRGKIVSFFVLCLAVAGVLALLYSENAISLRQKIYAIERFDDLLNDVLELRRYEKNIIIYRDPASLEEASAYLQKIERDYHSIQEETIGIIDGDRRAGWNRRGCVSWYLRAGRPRRGQRRQS